MPGAPNSDINPLATLNATSSAVRGQADPKTIVGVANQAQSPGEAITNIQAIAHSGNMMKMYDTLHGMPISSQAQAWGALSNPEQDSLRSLGYNPPNPDVLQHSGAGGSGGGLWGDIMGLGRDAVHDVENVAHRAAHDVNFGQVPGRAVGDTLNALGAPLRAVQHGIRTAYTVSEEVNPGPAAAGAFQRGIGGLLGYQMHSHPGAPGIEWGKLFSPSEWAHAWDESTNGQTFIDPIVHRKLNAQYGPSQVSRAINVAANGVNSVVAAAPQAQRQALINQFNDPKFQQLVSTVSNARISFGRMVVGQQYLNQHPEAGKVLSAGIDAATDVAMDPLMQLGRGMAAVKVLRYGATDSSRASDIIENSKGFNRWMQQKVVPYISTGRFGELGKADPRLDSVAEELSTHNIDTGDKFKDWLINKNGLKAIFSGDAAKISHQVPIVPHLSYLGWTKAGVKDALSRSIDAIADGKHPNIPLDDTDVFGAGDHAVLGANENRTNNFVNLLEKGKVITGPGDFQKMDLNPGRLVRRASTDIPTKPFIPYAKGAADVTNFRRFMQGILPAHMVNEGANLFVDGSEAQRRAMIMAVTKQWGHVTGLYNTQSGQEAMDRLTGAIEEEDKSQAFGLPEYDRTLDDNGVEQPHALYETQFSGSMRIPRPAEMRKLVRANGIMDLTGVHPMNAIDRAMLYWRTMILTRPGFAVRVALDENLNRLLREGPKPFIGSMLATGAARTRTDEDIEAEIGRALDRGTLKPAQVDSVRAGMKAASYKQILPYHPVERALRLLADRAPEGVRNNWRSIEEFYGGVMGATARKWVRQAENKGMKALGLDEYINGATHFAMHQPVASDALQDILSHMTGSPGFTLTPGSLVKYLREGIDGKPGYLVKGAGHSAVDLGNPLYAFKWQASLDHIARSKLGQAVLNSMDYSRDDQINSVLHVLNDPSFADTKAAFDRSMRMRNGGLAGYGGTTQEDVDRDFAESVVDNTNAHLRGGKYDPNDQGPLFRDLVDHMIQHGAGPDTELLDSVIKSDRVLPQSVVGPDLVPMESKMEGFLGKTFETLAGKPMNWMARQPHLIHQYTHALRDARGAVKEIIPDFEAAEGASARTIAKGEATVAANREKLASDMAFERSIKAMLPYIHNPSLRTYFEENHRILFPFLFAQRQFLMRWGRTFADSPAAIRELQLGMNGLRTSGVVQKDANGNEFFYYPGSQYVTEMITDTLNRLGIHATVPYAVPFTGEVKYLMPGLANPVTPSVGPFASVGMKELSGAFPQLQAMNQAVLGQGAAESPAEQFMPAIVNRLIAAFGPANAGSEKATTIAQMMKWMDANGQGLPQNPTAGDVEKYLDRLETGSTETMAVKAVLGFGLPATPSAQLDPQGLDARYKELLTLLPYDQALQQFYKEHPNGSAYTIGTTEGATSGNLPSTEADLAYTNQHVQFAKDYPAAFPWLAPRSPGTFSLTEFLEQETTGQRHALPIFDPAHPNDPSILTNIMNAKASKKYYAAVDQYDQAYSSTTDPQVHKHQTQVYDQWKQKFMAQNPSFSSYITTQTGKQHRETTIQQVRQALKDPELPQSSATPGLKTMIAAFDQFKAAYNQNLGNNTTAAYDAKVNIKNQTIAWGNQYVQTHGRVADFWNTIIRPEVDETTG